MKPYRSKVGNLLYYIGLLGLPLGVGVALGFYAGAWGMRWLPTMLEIFLMICIVSLLAIICGRVLEGSATKATDKGLRLRKRVVTSIVFVGIVILARLGVYWVKQPSPLTELSPAEFNMVFDAEMAKDCLEDGGIKASVVGDDLIAISPAVGKTMIELKVFAADAEKAKAVLEIHKGLCQEAADAEAEAAGDDDAGQAADAGEDA